MGDKPSRFAKENQQPEQQPQPNPAAPEPQAPEGNNSQPGPDAQAAAGSPAPGSHVDSASDDRTVNNTMRHQYRVLSDAEKAQMQFIKDMGLQFHDYLASMGGSRELSIARTKIEEAVMWAVKHVTR